MNATLRDRFSQRQLATWLIAVAVLALAFYFGRRASPMWLALLAAGAGGVLLLAQPVLGLFALVLASLVVRLEIGTGTDVRLNLAALLIPALLLVWLLDRVRKRDIQIPRTRASLPLLLFLGASLVSLLIGRATWDPMVPVGDNFLLVQLAQWAIFAFSALAFWLAASLIRDKRGLWRLTALFLLVGGGLAILRLVPGLGGVMDHLTTVALTRAPFWTLLAALAAGQLLFNRSLTLPWRAFLVVALGAALAYAFVQQQEAASNWIGLAAVLGLLIWLRFPRLRLPVVILLVALLALGVLIPSVYQFAGGDQEWTLSGGSRLTLISRVIEVTMRNPVTGLGPAAYRPYANMKPLGYEKAYWVTPQINSHNNYVDLFAHGGILGLLLFFWFAWEIARLGLALRKRHTGDFAAGYVNGMLAAGAGALVIMLLADWILPFVYNIGFPGFQASVLVWLFMGGLVALEQIEAKAKVEAKPEVEVERPQENSRMGAQSRP
jgi:O-antigen ligase